MKAADFLGQALAALVGFTALHAPAASAEMFFGVPLAHGDLLFARGADNIVLYEGHAGPPAETPEDLWAGARAQILSEDSRAAPIAEWSHADFLRHFTEGHVNPAAIQPMGGALNALGVSVGHVAIFAKEPDGTPFVFEAAGKAEGVRRIAWTDWRDAAVDKNDIWIARLRLNEAEIAATVAEALKFDGARYDITNRNLADTSAFYCSKLIWFAVRQATGIALDGNAEPDRHLWYSPLQLLRSDHLLVLASSTEGDFSGSEAGE